MDDPDERQRDESGSTLAKVIAATAAAAAGTRLGPEGGILLGAASPLFESLGDRVLDELRPRARRRRSEMLESCAETVGCDAEQLGKMIGSSENNILQTGLAMIAAERTTWPPQVRALGKALAAGLIATDEEEIDIKQRALAAMMDMDRQHVALLDVLVRYGPGVTSNAIAAIPQDGDFAVRRSWTDRQICETLPHLRPALAMLTATLQRHGLVVSQDTAPEALSKLANDLTNQINRQASRNQRGNRLTPVILNKPTTPRMDPRWSPTPQGAQVLSFYLEAGAAEGD